MEMLEANFQMPLDLCLLFEESASYIMNPELMVEAKKSSEMSLVHVQERLTVLEKYMDQVGTLCQDEMPSGNIARASFSAYVFAY